MRQYEARFPIEPLYPRCSEDLLLEVSKTMASPLPFPDDYLDFLRQWTGTLATEQMLVAPLQDALDDDFVGYVQKLYGVGDPGRGRDIRECQADYAFNERVPSHYVSIGQDGGWNRVAMSLEEKTRGHILMWLRARAGSLMAEMCQRRSIFIPLQGAFQSSGTS